MGVLLWSLFSGFEPVCWSLRKAPHSRPWASSSYWLASEPKNSGSKQGNFLIGLQYLAICFQKVVASVSLPIISMLMNGFGCPLLRPTSLRVPCTTWAPQQEAMQIHGWRRQKSLWAGYVHDLRPFDGGHFKTVKWSESLKREDNNTTCWSEQLCHLFLQRKLQRDW